MRVAAQAQRRGNGRARPPSGAAAGRGGASGRPAPLAALPPRPRTEPTPQSPGLGPSRGLFIGEGLGVGSQVWTNNKYQECRGSQCIQTWTGVPGSWGPSAVGRAKLINIHTAEAGGAGVAPRAAHVQRAQEPRGSGRRSPRERHAPRRAGSRARDGWGCAEGSPGRPRLGLLPSRDRGAQPGVNEGSASPGSGTLPRTPGAPHAGRGPAPPSPAARGRARITGPELGPRAPSESRERLLGRARSPNPPTGPEGRTVRSLGFGGRRGLLGGARPRGDGGRGPPTQRSPGRGHEPEQRRTGAGNAPPIGQA